MAQMLITDTHLTNIAAAIRAKLGTNTQYKPPDMDDAINAIPALKLLATKSLGTISTSSTTATDTGQTVSVSSINSYDLLIVETSVGTVTNGRHVATAQTILLTAGSTIGTKNGSAIATATWNVKVSSNGTYTSRSNTTKNGIYVNSVTISDGNATLAMYQKYNNTQTGTINGSYTVRVYGVKLYDLIGG